LRVPMVGEFIVLGRGDNNRSCLTCVCTMLCRREVLDVKEDHRKQLHDMIAESQNDSNRSNHCTCSCRSIHLSM
jgi:hypothetical protein